MTATVETGPGWTLHLGDCLDPVTGLASLADKSVDHVITDPPYGDHVHAKHRSGGKMAGESGSFSRAGDLGFPAITDAQMDGLSSGIARSCSRWSLIFCNAELSFPWMSRLSACGLDHVRMGAWVKKDGCPQFTGDRPAAGFETIVISHPPGRKKWNGGGKAGLWEAAIVIPGRAAEPRVHTTQKPIGLMLSLVSDFTDPGELICDPFSGSGTTGVACIQLGRRFVGWERDPKYFAVAVKRLRAAREQLGLFERPAVEKFKQATLTGVDQ